jgi:glutathione S-transferase
MKLYGGLLSPYVMRVVLAARAKGLDLPVVQPEGGLKTPDFLKLNPIGKMPTLIDGAFVLPESEIIVAYLEDSHPRPSLLPDDVKERARARLISRLADVYVAPSLGPFFQGKANEDTTKALNQALDYLEHFRTDDDHFAIGHQFSIADCTLIPMLFFFDVFQPQGKTADMVAARPRLSAFWERAKMSDIGIRCIREQGEAMQAFMKMRAGH